jgi:uncharacterized membrane protein
MFHKRLDALLKTALDRKIVTTEAADALRALAKDEVKERGALSLASVLGWLGGGAVILGVILLIGSKWDGIPDLLKIVCFLALLGGTHGVGFWITKAGLPYGKTAAAFHFIGGGLFLGGVGLVAQIYNLNGRPPNGVLLWLASLLPLVVLLRSASLSLLSIFAFMVWIHMEGAFSGSWLRMDDSFSMHLMIELGMGVALIGFSGLVKRWDGGVAAVFRACGALMLLYSVYALGFYRHYSDDHHWFGRGADASALLPWGVLALGAAGVAAGGRFLSPESLWLRNRLFVLLGVTLAVGAAVVAISSGAVSQGERIATSEFGWWRYTTAGGWAVTVFSWAVWFLLGLWCVAWGARSDRKGFVNLGVFVVGAGIITRFFDLMGSLAQTGFLFLLGGVVLLGTGFGMERWRRTIVRRMQAGKAAA